MKFLSLSLLFSLLAAAASTAAAADRDEWHMEYELKQRILLCEMLNRFSPGENVKEYFPYAAIPPELAQQRQVHTTFSVNGSPFQVRTVADQGPYHRLFMMARIIALTPVDHTNITVTATYETSLYSRQLKMGAGTGSVPPLSPADQALELQNTKWLDFNSPDFIKWLQAQNLVRTSQESQITFGRRVCEFVHDHMTYSYPTSSDGKPLSHLCQVLTGHCGHYAMLFVGIMRANGIPARCLVGNWIHSDKGPGHGDPHIKSEFFAQGIGWVPVDTTQGDHGQFGREDGNFLTYHLEVEPLGLPSPFGGTWWSFYFQGIYLPCEGGSWDKPIWTHWYTETPVHETPVQTVSSSPPNSETMGKPIEERLKELKRLLEQGLITQEAYDQKRKEIIDSL